MDAVKCDCCGNYKFANCQICGGGSRATLRHSVLGELRREFCYTVALPAQAKAIAECQKFDSEVLWRIFLDKKKREGEIKFTKYPPLKLGALDKNKLNAACPFDKDGKKK